MGFDFIIVFALLWLPSDPKVNLIYERELRAIENPCELNYLRGYDSNRKSKW